MYMYVYYSHVGLVELGKLLPLLLGNKVCKLTLARFLTYVGCVQTAKLRHTYWNIASKACPFHFRFAVSSDTFKQPGVMGRPPGVFNADCYGITPQDPSDTRMRVKLSEDPNTAQRFPLATAFASREEAAVECDFWKLVLRRKFFLEIPWSHGTYEEFVAAAPYDVVSRLNDESQWSHELLDFINEHHAMLHDHRSDHKPEVDLDEWERVAQKDGVRALFVWVQQVRALQASLAAVPDTSRLQTLSKSLNKLRGIRPPKVAKGSEYGARVNALFNAVSSIALSASQCDDLIFDIELKRRELKAALALSLNNRPPAIPDTEPGAPLYYQSEVT